MIIHEIKVFPGKNIYSHMPVVKMTLDIGRYAEIPTNVIKGFNNRLLELFPGLKEHSCGTGVPGGFIGRLSEGILIGHVLEHLAIELQVMHGHDVFYGKTRQVRESSHYNVIYQFKEERCGIQSGKAAFRIICDIAHDGGEDAGNILRQLKRVFEDECEGPGTAAIVAEAKRRGIPVSKCSGNDLIQLGYGRYSRCISGTLTDSPACISVDTACNKHLTKKLLTDYGIAVPEGRLAYCVREAVDAAEELGLPVVVKPCDANQGKGITMNIDNVGDLARAFKKACEFSKSVIVEKMIPGKDYRLLVVGGRLSAAAERIPPFITGDGFRTVRELIEIENRNPLRGESHEKPLTVVKIDDILIDVLMKVGKTLDSIPAINERIWLRDNANLSTGGSARNCSREVHPTYAQTAINAAAVLGLDIAGVDITAADISKPQELQNGAVVEVNAAPGIRMHLHPSSGGPQDVASDIIDMLFPAGQPCSIPVISITGTNGKTTTARLISHTLSMAGKKVGMTSTGGIFIDGRCILKGDDTGPASAGIVLSNRSIDAAVLETARGGIIRRGLGYDLADVGVITNISDDHLGLDGVNTLEDLAFVKALVIEAVKPDGYAVLNADDPMVIYLSGRTAANICYFSKNADNPLIRNHAGKGGKVLFIKGSMLYYFNGKRYLQLVDIGEIPITLCGVSEFNIENAMAAASALLSLGIPASTVKKGLRTFFPDIRTNPGRFNIFDMSNYKLILDYGHNPAGYAAVINAAQKIAADRYVGIIGMPGDRLESSISEVGSICGGFFSKIYIKEDRDPRGRKPGECAELLYNAAIAAGMEPGNIKTIYSETEALETAIKESADGDLIIMFHEEFEPSAEIITKYAAYPSEETDDKKVGIKAAV